MTVCLHKIGDHGGFNASKPPDFDVVFMHGLKGHHKDSWHNTSGGSDFYWPKE
jgi:hypothetical protein